jgi:hypothetical protein
VPPSHRFYFYIPPLDLCFLLFSSVSFLCVARARVLARAELKDTFPCYFHVVKTQPESKEKWSLA